MFRKKDGSAGKRRVVFDRLLISFLFCSMLSGCGPLVLFGAGTAAGVAGYKFYDGTMMVIYRAPYMETWDATMASLKDMGYTIRSSDHNMTSGKIVASDTADRAVRISIEYKSAKETEVGIRVGLLGDEAASNFIKDKITKELFKA